MTHSTDAELAVLGAAMYAPAECGDALDRLRPDHFFDPLNARCWDAVATRLRQGSIPDPITIAADVGAPLELVGGLGYLAELVDKANTWALPSHVDLILDRAQRRAVGQLARQMATAADSTEGSAEALLQALERGAAEIARAHGNAATAVPVGLTALDNLEAAWRGDFQGTPTGLQCLDFVTGGIRQDDVWFIAGRTSMGKSVVGLSLAKGIASRGRGVLMFSLEMPTREVQMRLISDIAHDPGYVEQVRYGDLLKGRTTHELRERSRDAARQLASLPFTVTDQGGLTIDEIRSQALRQVRAWEKAGMTAGAILIDHIGLVKPVRHSDSKAAETSYVVNELKALAKELRAPIIALVQVNRQTESRSDKRPTLADLNWSGAIEQIADMICLLYRPAYYLERSVNDFERAEAVGVRHDLELLVHKNRAGPICNLRAWTDVASNVVRDVA